MSRGSQEAATVSGAAIGPRMVARGTHSRTTPSPARDRCQVYSRHTCSTVQYSTYSTVQYSTVQPRHLVHGLEDVEDGLLLPQVGQHQRNLELGEVVSIT